MGNVTEEQRKFGRRVSRWLEFARVRNGSPDQKRLAEKMGASEQAVGNWLKYAERGGVKGRPSIDTLLAMHKELAMPIAVVFQRDPSKAELASGIFDFEHQQDVRHHNHAAG